MTTKAGVGGLGRWGRFVAHHRWWVLALWLVALVAVVSVGKGRQHDTNDDFAIPGTDAQRAVAVLQERFPSQNNATANVVFHAPTGTLSTPAAQQAIAATTTALKGVPGVGGVGSLVSAPNGATAYLTVTFDQPASAFTPSDRAPYDALVAAAAPARPASKSPSAATSSTSTPPARTGSRSTPT